MGGMTKFLSSVRSLLFEIYKTFFSWITKNSVLTFLTLSLSCCLKKYWSVLRLQSIILFQVRYSLSQHIWETIWWLASKIWVSNNKELFKYPGRMIAQEVEVAKDWYKMTFVTLPLNCLQINSNKYEEIFIAITLLCCR